MKYTNLSMVKGDTLSFAFDVEGVNEIENAYFTCKANQFEKEYVFQESLNGGGIYKIENGKYGVRVPPAATKDIEAGLYYYDLQIQANLDVFTPLIGHLEIVQDITAEG